jgi:cellulose biosynthesis protein BcsQ
LSLLYNVISTTSGQSDDIIQVSEHLLFNKTYGFRGIVSGVGCSTIVKNVAIGLALKSNLNICILDMNMLYPYHYHELTLDNDSIGDIFDYGGVLSDVVTQSVNYGNLYVLGFKNRTIVDMLSPKENKSLAEKLFEEMKSFFDVILIDLSYEPTSINAYFGVKCNKIFTVVDESHICLASLSKSLEHICTLGVPMSKMLDVIVNKDFKNVNSGIYTALRSFGMSVVTKIPFAEVIAVSSVTAKRIYDRNISNNINVSEFTRSIDRVVSILVEDNELTKDQHFSDVGIQREEIDLTHVKVEMYTDNGIVVEDVESVVSDDEYKESSDSVISLEPDVKVKKGGFFGFGNKGDKPEKEPKQRKEKQPKKEKPVKEKKVKQDKKSKKDDTTDTVEQSEHAEEESKTE